MKSPSPKIKFVSGGIALMLAAIGFVGCGTSGESNSDVSRADFIDAANRICDQHNEFLRQAMVDAFGSEQEPGDQAGIRFTREVWIPDIREQDEALRELDWPPADQQRIETMLDQVLETADMVEASPEITSEGPFDDVTAELEAYGIGSCGSP